MFLTGCLFTMILSDLNPVSHIYCVSESVFPGKIEEKGIDLKMLMIHIFVILNTFNVFLNVARC